MDEIEARQDIGRTFVVGGDLAECRALAAGKDGGKVVLIATGVHRAPSFNERQ